MHMWTSYIHHSLSCMSKTIILLCFAYNSVLFDEQRLILKFTGRRISTCTRDLYRLQKPMPFPNTIYINIFSILAS